MSKQTKTPANRSATTAVATQRYAALVAEGRALLGVREDDPWWQRRGAIRQAAREGHRCGECQRKLKPNEPVWRQRLSTGPGFMGRWGRTLAPVCQKCMKKEQQADAKYGFQFRTPYEEAKPCEGCGRPVYNLLDLVFREHTFCCEVCQDKVLSAATAAAARAARAVARGPCTCATCNKTFTPTRTDTHYCSAACKQRAYRHRVTANKKGAGRLFVSRNASKEAR